MKKRRFFADLAEVFAEHLPHGPYMLGRVGRRLAPHPGTLLTTLLLFGLFVLAQGAGAISIGAPRTPNAPNASTTTISYQGRLADTIGNPITGTVGIQFNLYNSNVLGSPLWTEGQTAVPVENGLFHVLLGSVNSIPVSVLASNPTLWLGITVGGDNEMAPREQIASAPYAMVASSVADGSITTSKIVDEAVTAAKLAPGAIASDGWNSTSVGLAYSSADGPTFVVTTASDLSGVISLGYRMKMSNNATTFYGIATAITASQITLYGGTDYTLANSPIANVYYSNAKAPTGFPLDPGKWTIVASAPGTAIVSPAAAAWYNLGGSIVIPIGAWSVTYQGTMYGTKTTTGFANVYTTLSTGNNSESDVTWTTSTYGKFGTADGLASAPFYRSRNITLTSRTSYFANASTTISGAGSIGLRDADISTYVIITAVCAYL